jgi:hypothetical protein
MWSPNWNSANTSKNAYHTKHCFMIQNIKLIKMYNFYYKYFLSYWKFKEDKFWLSSVILRAICFPPRNISLPYLIVSLYFCDS